MDTQLLATFMLASTLLSLAPGPDNLFVLTQAALYGPRAGIFVTLGLCTGLLVHTSLVALGVAALFMVSATAFLVLKLAGATYLLYLAWGAFRASASAMGGERNPALTARQLYLRGILMNLGNPKVAIFFLAFLPQFASPEAGSLQFQLFVLGMVFIFLALLVFALIATLAGHLATWLKGSLHAQVLMNRLAGVVFVGLAARLIASSR